MSDWLPWHGGGRPVSGETRVLVRLRNGDEMKRPARARSRIWEWDSSVPPPYQIVAYKVAP